MKKINTDVLIVGTGLASLALALKISHFAKVTILTKEKCADTNTSMAQGGIAAVLSQEDSFESHIHDTEIAGAGLCKLDAVKRIVEQAPDRIEDLQNWGVHFDLKKDPQQEINSIDLTREGGHSHRRILHFEDQTGLEIHSALLRRVKEDPRIQIHEMTMAIDLILNKQVEPYEMKPNACVGIYALDRDTGKVVAYMAKQTVLATGGAGKVYLYTSNWAGATGDGIAMAFRSGCRVANLEFTQFHPTCLYHPEARNFLISEALRGEGGELIDSRGIAFMKKYHPLGSLAPRDIVARSIDAEIKRSGHPCVYLDMTKQPRDFLLSRFPAIFNKCLEHGIDMSIQPIPVVPAAHYQCGGVITDVSGQTDLPGLRAIGETACTGLHGANRLASNSLLECIAMAHMCGQSLESNWKDLKLTESIPPEWQSPEDSNDDEMIVITHMWEEIRRLMWNYVGIVRSNKRLERAQHRLTNILEEVKDYYSNMKIHSDILELRNIALVAHLTVECALKRKESLGIHYNLDYMNSKSTDSVKKPSDTILFSGQ